jgi:hypothetical protein
LLLHADLHAQCYSESLAETLKRTFLYIAPVTVAMHGGAYDDAPANKGTDSVREAVALSGAREAAAPDEGAGAAAIGAANGASAGAIGAASGAAVLDAANGAGAAAIGVANGAEALGNILRLKVKVRYPYWEAGSAEADEIWEGSLRPWLKNILYKIGSTLEGLNRASDKKGEGPFHFQWLELQFGQLTIALALCQGNALPKDTQALVEEVRLQCAQSLPQSPLPLLVRLPSRESLDAQAFRQRLAAMPADASSEPANTAPPCNSGKNDASADDSVPPGSFYAAPGPKPQEGLAGSLDYSLWGIELADGTRFEHDSKATSA